MNPALSNLLELWRAQGITLRAGASEDAISSFESRYGVRLPLDYREFLLHTDGLDSDDTVTKYWSISDLRPATEVFDGTDIATMCLVLPSGLSHPNSYFVFADTLIWSHFYAIHLGAIPESGGQVAWIGYRDSWTAAESFTEFMQCYVAKPQQADWIGAK